MTTVLPIVNLSGAYVAQYLYKKCKNQEAMAAVCLFLVAVLALTGIWIGKDVSMILTVVLFALTTASMMETTHCLSTCFRFAMRRWEKCLRYLVL